MLRNRTVCSSFRDWLPGLAAAQASQQKPLLHRATCPRLSLGHSQQASAQTAWCPAQPQTRQCSSTLLRGQRPGACRSSTDDLPSLLQAAALALTLEPRGFIIQPGDRLEGGKGIWGPRNSRSRQATAWSGSPGPPLEPRHAAALPGGAGRHSTGLGAKASPVAAPAHRHLGSPGPRFSTCDNGHSQDPLRRAEGKPRWPCALWGLLPALEPTPRPFQQVWHLAGGSAGHPGLGSLPRTICRVQGMEVWTDSGVTPQDCLRCRVWGVWT